MTSAADPFVGTWKLNSGRSLFDPKHRPQDATMVIEPKGDGYRMIATGINAKGEPVSERPRDMVPDGRGYPVEGFPGLVVVSSRPDERTLHTEVRREDGSIAGGGTLTVAANGTAMTAVNFGFDSQLREFRQETAWDRA
jgi:hypothetical protein